MPFRYIVAFCFITPLIGIMQMEAGTYGGNVLQAGHANGASLAFAFGIVVFLATVAICKELRIFSFAALKELPVQRPSSRIWILAVASLVAMVGFTLFVSGGINVILRLVGRGDFRAGLGDTGAVSYLILKYYSPAVLAYLALLYSHRPWYDTLIPVGLPAIIVAVIALCFGFKSGVVLALLPAAIVYFWRMSSIWIAPLAGLALAFIYGGYVFFEGPSDPSAILDRLFYRVTVLQGDVAWKIWDLHVRGEPLPSYVSSLPGIFGDRIFTLATGVDRSAALAWVETHFGLLTTYLAGYPLHVILAGYNNTATIFSEGVLMGGILGVLAISVLAGVLTTALYHFLQACLRTHRYAEASLASSYFVFGLMAWLLGGGVTAIVHISILVGLVSGYVLLRLVGGYQRIGGERYVT